MDEKHSKEAGNMYIITIIFLKLVYHRDTAKAAEAPRPGRFHRT